MLAFHIVYTSDKKSYAFSDIKKITSLLSIIYAGRWIVETPNLSTNQGDTPPDDSCVRNFCAYLPEKYIHTCQIPFQCKNVNDILLFSSLYKNICEISGYTFSLVSL